MPGRVRRPFCAVIAAITCQGCVQRTTTKLRKEGHCGFRDKQLGCPVRFLQRHASLPRGVCRACLQIDQLAAQLAAAERCNGELKQLTAALGSGRQEDAEALQVRN